MINGEKIAQRYETSHFGVPYEVTQTLSGAVITRALDTDLQPDPALVETIASLHGTEPADYVQLYPLRLGRSIPYRSQRLYQPNYTNSNCYLTGEFVLKDPVEFGHGEVQFHAMNAIARALKNNFDGLHAPEAPVHISSVHHDRTITFYQQAPGVHVDKYFEDILEAVMGKQGTWDQDLRDQLDKILSDRVKAGTGIFFGRWLTRLMLNDSPVSPMRRKSSGTGNILIDSDAEIASLDAAKTSRLWLIDQGHPTVLARVAHSLFKNTYLR